MKMITKAIEKEMERNPIGSHDGEGLDAPIICKFFNPYGRGTWLITEAEKQEDGDWLLFGYCNIFEWEWGYIMLSEILNTRVNMFGCKLPLERDMYADGTVRDNVPSWELSA